MHAARRRADPRDPRATRRSSSRSARARPPAGSRRCATSRTSATSSPPCTPPRLHLDAADFDRDRRPCARRLRAAGCPINKSSCSRSSARSSPDAGRTCRRTASASSASARARPASWCAGHACLGPVTHAGCGALCPLYARGCFGCFGPKEQANTESLCGPLARDGRRRRAAAARLPRLQRNAPRLPREADVHE